MELVGSSLQKGANSHPIWHRWLDTVLRTSFSPHPGSNREVEQRCLHERISQIRLGSRYPRSGRATRRVLTRAGFYFRASGQGFDTSRQRCKLLERQSLGMCIHKVTGAQCLQWCFPVASFTCFVISFFFRSPQSSDDSLHQCLFFHVLMAQHCHCFLEIGICRRCNKRLYCVLFFAFFYEFWKITKLSYWPKWIGRFGYLW